MTPTDDDVSIKLRQSEWNAVFEQLMNGPWRIVNPLLQKMGEQARVATEGPAPPPPTNGVDSHAPN